MPKLSNYSKRLKSYSGFYKLIIGSPRTCKSSFLLLPFFTGGRAITTGWLCRSGSSDMHVDYNLHSFFLGTFGRYEAENGREILLNINIYFFCLLNKFQAGLGGSVGCAVRLETRRSRVQPPPRSATFFRGD